MARSLRHVPISGQHPQEGNHAVDGKLLRASLHTSQTETGQPLTSLVFDPDNPAMEAGETISLTITTVVTDD